MPQLRPPKAPNLSKAPKEYDAGSQEWLNNELRQYFNAQDGVMRQLLKGFNNYGTFIDTTTQTPAAINTAYPITLNTTVEAFGIARGTPTSRIIVPVGGVFCFNVSLQVANTSGGTDNTWFWFRKNGADIPNSASHTVNRANGDTVAAIGYNVTMQAGDYLEVVYSTDSLNTSIHAAAAAPPVPAVPSIIVAVNYLFPDAVG